MKDMAENNPKSVSALQKYAYYLRENERFEEALVQAKRVLELAPDNSVGLWLCGCCYLSLGEAAKNLSENPFHELTAQDAWKGGSGIGSKAEECYKTAEDYLNRGIKADKSDRAMYMVMANVKIHLGRRNQAIEVLRQGLEATRGSDGYASLLYDLTNACISEARFAEAEKCIKELRGVRLAGDRPFPQQLIGFLQAKMGLMKGDWKTARTILCDILPKLQDAPGTQKVAYVYLGQCYHQENNSEQEIFAYSVALKIDPLFTSARAGLAEVYLSRGGLPAAAAQWQVIVNGPHPDPEAASPWHGSGS